MAGRRTDALGALRWALDTGVAPVLITSALAGSLRNLGKYLEFQDSRMRAADLARAVGVPHWKVKDLARQASTWSPGAVARAIGLVAKADAAVKGAESDPAFALEQLVLSVTALPSPRARRW
jgi:DNA polymerase-3 subunit delta